jgi:hypothetical protein
VTDGEPPSQLLEHNLGKCSRMTVTMFKDVFRQLDRFRKQFAPTFSFSLWERVR